MRRRKVPSRKRTHGRRLRNLARGQWVFAHWRNTTVSWAEFNAARRAIDTLNAEQTVIHEMQRS